MQNFEYDKYFVMTYGLSSVMSSYQFCSSATLPSNMRFLKQDVNDRFNTHRRNMTNQMEEKKTVSFFCMEHVNWTLCPDFRVIKLFSCSAQLRLKFYPAH